MGNIFIGKLFEFEKEGKIEIIGGLTDDKMDSIVSQALNAVANPKYQVNAKYLWRHLSR